MDRKRPPKGLTGSCSCALSLAVVVVQCGWFPLKNFSSVSQEDKMLPTTFDADKRQRWMYYRFEIESVNNEPF